MSKQFGQMGQGFGVDPTKLAAPAAADTPPIIGEHGASSTIDDHGMPSSSDDGTTTPPIMSTDHTSPDGPQKRKKIDWKGLIQNSLAGAGDNNDEDPLAVLQMQNSNQNTYMNPRTY